MIDFETLMKEHDRLGELTARLASIVAGPPAPEQASALVTALAAELSDHLAKEDSEIYPRLAASADRPAATLATEMTRDFVALTADWVAYLVRWPQPQIAADWPGFAAETAAMVTRLNARIAQEDRLLYPAALRGGHIRLRAA